jgi:tetratricopeptide (TPR) repeat protein
VTLKPSGSSYARISYALELQGDLAGAVEAMRLASDASPAVGPTAAWVRTLIGNLYVAEGRLELGARSYRDALGRSAAYAPALAGLAAVETRRGRLPHAAELYGRALEIAPVPDHAVALGDVLARMNREAEAEAAYASAQRLESRFARFGGRNELETALFDLDQDRELRSALARARVGAQLRPSVEGEHVLAWALYKNGRCQDARARSIRALRLGTLDVGAMYHRVLIERCLGNEIAAESFLARVRALDPSFLDAPPSSFRLGDATDG